MRRIDPGGGGEGRCGPGGFSGRHAARDLLRRVVHTVVDGNAAAGDQEIRHLACLEAAVGHRVDGAVLRPVPRCRNGVFEVPVDVAALEGLPAEESPALGDAQLVGDTTQMCVFEAGPG